LLGRIMSAAKATPNRRARNPAQPDAGVKRLAIAIAVSCSFGQASNDTDPWQDPRARIKPDT
jgi:hypothetical protein